MESCFCRREQLIVPLSTGQITLTDLNDVRQYVLFLNGNFRTQIYDPNGGSYNPNFPTQNVVISPELYVSGGDGSNLLPSAKVKSVTWYEGTQTTTPLAESTSGTTPLGMSYAIPSGAVASVNKTLTLKSNLPSNSIGYTCVVVYTDPQTDFDVTMKAYYDITKITNGQKGDAGVNAVTGVLTNEGHTVPSDINGNNQVYGGSGTEIHVYEGANELDYDGVGTANGKYKVTASGSGITPGAISDSGLFATVANQSNMTGDTASISYTITGKRADGSAFSFVKMQTFSKAKQGTSPTLYRLITSANAIAQNISNVYNPSTITVKGTSAVGSATPADYAARFIIAEADRATPTTFVDKYTSANSEPTSGKVYTPSNSTVAAIRVRIYIGGTGNPVHGTTQMLDEQTIPVVRDGATGNAGVDSYFLNLWAPNGDTIRNSGGEILLQADLYKGAGQVTPTAYKWYTQDPAATTASGGDSDGGNGWRLINSVAAASTAPTLAQVANASTKLTAGTYYVKYTWMGLSGETTGSSEATLAVSAGNDLRVTIPAFPTNAVGAKVYVGTSAGANKYVGDITTSAGNIVVTKLDPNALAIPTVNTATNVTSGTLTVKPFAIAGVEGFKVVATAPVTGTKYTGVTVVRDFQDPISVDVVGTNIFKNGVGTVTLTAQLIQAGLVIPNTGFTFSWALYNANGSLAKTYPSVTGDTITIPATDVAATANLVVDVNKA